MEKQTFKNPSITSTYSEYEVATFQSSGKFRTEDWDMEVTFTKKFRKEIRVGDTVRFKAGDDDWRTKVVTAVHGSLINMRQETTWTGIASSSVERVE